MLSTKHPLHALLIYLRKYAQRKHVRPWSLAGPILVLLVCLPLLSPLRHPLRAQMSDEEMAHWATVQALVERQTFEISQTAFAATRQKTHIDTAVYSDQPPVQGLLLAGPYWVLYKLGIRFASNPSLVQYLLTLIGVTIPVAAAAGMVYRMGRLFELRRPLRALFGLAVVFGSGLISYATVLNPYAPAAALLMGAVAILVQVSLIRTPLRSGAFLTAAGFFTALAAAIFPAALVFVFLFGLVVLSMRWRWSLRIGGLLMFGIGLIPPVLLHLSLSLPITGDWRLGLVPSHPTPPVLTRIASSVAKPVEPDDDSLVSPPSAWQMSWIYLYRLTAAFLGTHGIFTHFPVLIFGVAGLGIVIRRHWPATAKMLAIATLLGAVIILVHYIAIGVDWRWAMFGVRWYVVFLPLVLFWAGAWLRKTHHPATWTVAAVLLAFSTFAGILGATYPMPHDGYDRYTVAGAIHHLVRPDYTELPTTVAER